MPRAAAADKRSTATGYITTSGNNIDKKYQQQKTTKYTQKIRVHKSKNEEQSIKSMLENYIS